MTGTGARFGPVPFVSRPNRVSDGEDERRRESRAKVETVRRKPSEDDRGTREARE